MTFPGVAQALWRSLFAFVKKVDNAIFSELC